uniref:Putative regulator with two PAS domains n=1 Tax=Magnetococcus massalia (strain MO-1) TaxID=451514 RepID=A0A1S7LI43_MAGMO|nr:Putative regulator with two PAS domains [Candidatus Magnetococcus massalia]
MAKRGEAIAMARWQPTADYLSEKIPHKQFRIIPMRFDEAPLLIRNQLIDFTIANPAIYIDLEAKFGVQRIVTLKNRLSANQHVTQFGSAIFSRAEHPEVSKLSHLIGRTVAAVHETSLGGWIMAIKTLENAGVTRNSLAQVQFLNTHDAVVKGVLEGRYDAGIVRTDTIERMAIEKKIDPDRLQILGQRQLKHFPFRISTDLYPEWPVARAPHTDSALAEQIALVLMQLPPDHPAAVAAHIHGWTVPENYQPVHGLLKKLGLPPYDHYEAISIWQILTLYWPWIVSFTAIMALLIVGIALIYRLNNRLSSRQKALQQMEARYQATFEQSALGILYISPTGKLQRVNQALCVLSGFTAYELHKMNWNDLSYPEDLAQELPLYEALKRGERSDFQLEKRLLRKDGSRLWVRITFSCIRSSQGELQSLVGVLDDISERKQLEEAKEQTDRLHAVILNTSGDGILGLDLDGCHTFVNPAASQMLGWSADELLGKAGHALWHHTQKDGSLYNVESCPITAVLNNAKVHRGHDELFWRKDQSSFLVDYISTPIMEEGRVTGAVVIFHANTKEEEKKGIPTVGERQHLATEQTE